MSSEPEDAPPAAPSLDDQLIADTQERNRLLAHAKVCQAELDAANGRVAAAEATVAELAKSRGSGHDVSDADRRAAAHELAVARIEVGICEQSFSAAAGLANTQELRRINAERLVAERTARRVGAKVGIAFVAMASAADAYLAAIGEAQAAIREEDEAQATVEQAAC